MPKDPLDLLQPGERVVWAGRPSRCRALRLTDAVIVAIAACWVIVAAQSVRDFALPALPGTLFADLAALILATQQSLRDR